MIFHSAMRSLIRAPLRTIFTLLSIAVGLAGFFCMTTLTQLVPQSVNQSAKQLLGADIAVRSYLQPTTLNALQHIIAESDRQALTGAYVSLTMITSSHKTSNIVMKGIDPNVYPFYGEDQFSLLRGLQSDEVLLSRQAAARLQASPGDTVSFVNHSDGSLSSFRVKGLVDGVQESYTDSGFWGMAYISYPRSLELMGLPAGTINEAFIRLHDPGASQTIKEQIQARIIGSQAIDIEDKKVQANADSKVTLLVMQLFSMLAIAIAGITIFNTMTILMSSRQRDIAIMKSIGMTARRIACYFLLEAAFIGILGTAAGIAAGSLFGVGLTAYIAKMLGLPLAWQFSSQAVIFTCTVGISIALISAWPPIYRSLQVSPLELLQQSSSIPVSRKLPFRVKLRLFLVVCLEIGVYLHETLLASSQDAAALKWIAAFVLSVLILCGMMLVVMLFTRVYGLFYRLLGLLKHIAPSGWFIPLHNLGSEYKRNALLTVTLSVAVLSVVASQLFTDNLVTSVEHQMEQQLKGNLILSAAVTDEQAVQLALQHTPGIEQYNKGYEMKGAFSRINGEEAVQKFRAAGERGKLSYLDSTNVSIQGIESSSSDRAYTIKAGRDLEADDDGKLSAVLLEDYAKDVGIATGDIVEVTLNNHQLRLEIVGFFESGAIKTAGIRIPMSTLEAYGQPTRLIYYVEASARDLQNTMAALNQSLPSSAVAYSVNGTVIESLQKTLSTQSTFFSTIALFSFATAILMIGNQAVISLIQKKRDVAIFKTIGWSTGRLLRSILTENLILAFIAGVLGSALGFIFAVLALSLFVKGNIDISLTWCGIGIALSLLSTAVVTLLASLQTFRTKPLHLLRGL
ncbi:FtsX-like permease family protein [Paenibacillus thiaminolyticus]|uniref:ABC transporter permease n=1 Tax=Paenibacillus thiaminolyticus TaxID=49283 RepID=UPI003D2CE9DA